MSAIFGSIVLGSPDWAGTVAAATAVFLVALAVGVVRSPVPAAWKWGLFALKAVAVVLLGLCLLDPLVQRSHFKSGENIVVALADRSSSMNVRDDAQVQETRAEWTKALLTDPNSEWLTRLAQDFDLRRYTFGATVTHVEGFQDLAFDAPSTQLSSALTTLQDRFSTRPVAALLLFTDGVSTDTVDFQKLSTSVPIFPVVSDEADGPGDIAIDSISVTQTNFEDAPIEIKAALSASKEFQRPLRATLEPIDAIDENDRRELILTPTPGQPLIARFEIKPESAGALFYKLRVVPADHADVFDKPESSLESTLANNERLVAVNRDPHDYRILYVGGRPNWEHKFLGRALAEDDHLQLVSLVRIARKETKFDFRGRPGESTNSMYRGMDKAPDELTEAFDQPVLKRLNVRDQTELSDGFPRTKEDLYRYEAVILDDIESEFFTHDQLSLLDTFVSERGGGLVMLGGRDSFREGHWEHTPIADSLPIYIDRPGEPLQGHLVWELTREGWLEPWMRTRSTQQGEEIRLRDVPALELVNNTRVVKPGARVLAEVEDAAGRTNPALVVQQYGRGRTAAVLVGDLWKWSINRPATDEDDLAKAWRQTARWLVGDVPKRIEAAAQPDAGGPHPAMQISVRVRNKEFQPQDETLVKITVKQPDGAEVTLDAQPSLKEPGLFETLFVSREPGAYVARIEAPGDGEEAPVSTELGWSNDPAAAEFQQTSVNRTLLDELARKTGGQVVSRAGLMDLVVDLPTRDLPVMEMETTPLWHRPWILMIVLALLGAEWGLRRMRGLA